MIKSIICDHKNYISSIYLSTDESLILTGSYDMTAKVIKLESGICIHTLVGHKNFINCALFSSTNEKVFTCSDDRTIKSFDIRSGICLFTFSNPGLLGRVFSMLLTHDNITLISGAGNIQYWNISNGNIVKTLYGHHKSINCLEWCNTNMFISGSGDGTIKLWNYSKGSCLKTFSGHTKGVFTIIPWPDKLHFMSGSSDRSVKIWSLDSEKFIYTINYLGLEYFSHVNKVAISNNGKHVAVGFDGEFFLYNLLII
jgi:WD40 repeat protein